MSQEQGAGPLRGAPHYRAVFEAGPDAYLIVDASGRIVLANEAASDMFGYGPEEFPEMEVERLVPESRREVHERHRAEYALSPHRRPMGIGMELAAERADGSRFPVEVALSPVEEGDARYIVASVRDVTERKRLRAFRAAAIQASENERARIARELHDDTAQQLAAAIIHLRLIGRAEAEKRTPLLNELRDALTGIAEGVRRIARGLRPPELEEVGLESAVRGWSRTLVNGDPFTIDLEADAVDGLLTAEQRLMFYRIIQEALTNAHRHSGATRVRVRVSEEDGQVVATIRDDGRGFDPDLALTQVRGLGLHGMTERAQMIGARIQIRSALAEGTEVRLELPRNPQGEE